MARVKVARRLTRRGFVMRKLLQVSATLFTVLMTEASASEAACTPTHIRFYGFETAAGLSDWKRVPVDGSDHNWRGIQACTPQAGSKIFRYGGAGCTDDYTTSNFSFAVPSGATGIAIPAGAQNTRLSFGHRWRFEPDYDGGALYVSFNQRDYFSVPASAIISGATYNGTTLDACAPFGGANNLVFTGVQSTFVNTTVNLDAVCGAGGCAGRTLWIAFAAISDCSITDDGWFLDNVAVTACVPM
jgi:hypothetical protein